MRDYHVLGIMSGSSLDGLDVAYCIIHTGENYTYSMPAAATFDFPGSIATTLRDLPSDPEAPLEGYDLAFATFCAQSIAEFMQNIPGEPVTCIALHGHTAFHYPTKGISRQIGDAKRIAELTGIPVIADFRQADIDAGGQGAPLVPIADELFFGMYDSCLNIGGIANISFKLRKQRIGFDICPANQLLNFCASALELPFDRDGEFARQGHCDAALLAKLKSDPYLKKPFPKSLDNTYIKNTWLAGLADATCAPEDKLHTATQFIAEAVADVITGHCRLQEMDKSKYNMLVSGGGAFNMFLIECMIKSAGIGIALPDAMLIQYKEALAMALMAVLRLEGKPNFLPSVTGASKAVCGGTLYGFS